jgi:transposase-like protein
MEKQKNVPETEVVEKAQRRRFTAAYKRSIVNEADACKEPGQVGALLRREGLYSSHLSDWRRELEKVDEAALSPKKRGPKVDPRERKLSEQAQELERLRARAERAELLVEIQKKVSMLLGISLEPSEKRL